MTTQQKDCAKTEGEVEIGGGREEVAGGEATSTRRTRATLKREGSATGTRTIGGETRTH